MKNHIRDYATAAFRFYAKQNMSADEYKKMIYDEALEDYKKRQKREGISFPTESAIIRAEKAVDEKLAEIKDIEAVGDVLTILSGGLREYECYGDCACQGRAIRKSIEMVYFVDADKELKKGDIHDRIHKASIWIPASERQVYRWLGKAREIFAERRGLRI
jgi:hypothetical protein